MRHLLSVLKHSEEGKFDTAFKEMNNWSYHNFLELMCLTDVGGTYKDSVIKIMKAYYRRKVFSFIEDLNDSEFEQILKEDIKDRFTKEKMLSYFNFNNFWGDIKKENESNKDWMKNRSLLFNVYKKCYEEIITEIKEENYISSLQEA